MDISKPLSPTALHILLVLTDGESHGYAIMQGVRERSAGQIPLGTGSLYRHLARLIDDGFVSEMERRQEDSRRGVHYRITPKGRQALTAERRRLADLVAAIDGLRAARKGSA